MKRLKNIQQQVNSEVINQQSAAKDDEEKGFEESPLKDEEQEGLFPREDNNNNMFAGVENQPEDEMVFQPEEDYNRPEYNM